MFQRYVLPQQLNSLDRMGRCPTDTRYYIQLVARDMPMDSQVRFRDACVHEATRAYVILRESAAELPHVASRGRQACGSARCTIAHGGLVRKSVAEIRWVLTGAVEQIDQFDQVGRG